MKNFFKQRNHQRFHCRIPLDIVTADKRIRLEPKFRERVLKKELF